jgi:acetolactate synthase-1/2/3 large subunit
MVNRAIEPVGVDIYTPDFIGVAKALGCAAEAVNGVEQLRTALRVATDRQGPTLIEIDQAEWTKAVSK